MSIRSLRVLRCAAALAAVLLSASAARADVPVYSDDLASGFADWSWQPGGDAQTDVDLALASPVHSGGAAIDYRAHDWNGLSFAHPTQDFSPLDYPELRFFVRGAAGGEQLTLTLQRDGGAVASAPLAGFVTGGAIAAGEWREVVVPLAEPPLSLTDAFDRIDLHDASGVAGHASAQRVFVDAVRLVAGGELPPEVFADGFEGGAGNAPPVATPDAYALEALGILDEPAPGVLGNDSDPDGDALTAHLVGAPAHAAFFALAADGGFDYQHDGGPEPSDSFSYRVSDGQAFSAPVSVTLTISAGNAAPVAQPDAYQVEAFGILDEPAPGVLGNDSDADGDPLTAELVSGPAHADAFALAADGSFDYQHDGSPEASDSFSYRVGDGQAFSTPVTVTITVQQPDPPESGRWVSGYYVGYERLLYPIEDVDFSAITHLMVGRVIPNADGSVATHFDIDAVNGPLFAQAAVDAAHAAGRQAILMVGGAGEINGWRGAASDPNRAAFVANLLATMDQFGADGLDIDWEPIQAQDHAPLLALVQALRAARPGMLITMPVGGINVNFPPAGEGALFQALHPLLDQLNVMSYDMAQAYEGWHSWFASALDGEYANAPMSVESSVAYYLGLGVPAAKLGVGTGFYGACYNGVSAPRQPAQGLLVASDGAMSYRNIVEQYLPGMTRTYDAVADAPWLGSAMPQGPQGCTFVSYEDAESIAAKGAWVAANGLGGTIIWTVAQGHRPGANPPDPLLDAIRDAFLAGEGGGDPVAALQVERDVMVDSMLSDRFTWIDSSGQPRSAVLAHNDGQVGPSGTRGGALRQFRYETGGGTRTVRAMTNAFGGFGYAVSHPAALTHCIGGFDSSSLGHLTPGAFQRVFEGRHHAILRFTQAYPRYCTTAAPAAQYDLPVTIDWVFSTGRDHPLWSITWDMSAIPVNRLMDDARAPYGEMMIDGAANAAARSQIAGVAWGDYYKFTTTSAPVTFESDWTWNQPNTIPYVKVWTTAVDATMGTVATRPIAQQDAGGYWGLADWNTTSATPGSGCDDNGQNMPCDYNWPFQSINYELYGGATQNARVAWGTNFGFLGQASYRVHGNSWYGGNLPGDPMAAGHPRKSYSTHIVLGLHSTAPVEAQVAEAEALQQLTLTASTGSVATEGPGGVADPTPATYQPAGYDHVRGALTFIASANQLDANLALAAGTLSNPLIVLRGYTLATPPGLVRLGDAALVADVDYFASVRADADELWLTLARDIAGPVNRLRIDP